MLHQFATLAETTTTADPGAAGLGLDVASRTLFSQAPQFHIVVQNSETDKTNREIMLVTAGVGAGAGTFTVTRGQEGTAGVAHPVGSYVAETLTAGALLDRLPVVRTQLADDTTAVLAARHLTDLDVACDLGTYTFRAYLSATSAATTTGHKFSCNFTGTVTSFLGTMRTTSSTTSVATTASMVGSFPVDEAVKAFRAKDATASWGPTTTVDAINQPVLYVVDGIMVVTVAGTFEVYWSPEVAASATVKADSVVILQKVA